MCPARRKGQNPKVRVGKRADGTQYYFFQYWLDVPGGILVSRGYNGPEIDDFRDSDWDRPKTGWRVFRRSVGTALSDAGTSEDNATGSRARISAYHAGVLHAVGGGISTERNIETGTNSVPKCSRVRGRAYANSLKRLAGRPGLEPG